MEEKDYKIDYGDYGRKDVQTRYYFSRVSVEQ